MELYFLDVGQATCQVILLGQNRAIVIDCGLKRDDLLLRFLERKSVHYIERLIISHSDSDHIGGAVALLGQFQGRIGQLLTVDDGGLLNTELWARISQQLNDGLLSSSELARLEMTDKPQEVWSEPNHSVSLSTYSPTFPENLLAKSQDNKNASSAVLLLKAGPNRVLFGADAEFVQWQAIHERNGQQPLRCDVLAVPHHGGCIDASNADVTRLFTEIVVTGTAIVSAGTSNQYRHPRPEVISALRSGGATVLCTQITRQCHPDLESLRPGVLAPRQNIGVSSSTMDTTGTGNSRNVACAGTVCVSLTASSLKVHEIRRHQDRVNQLIQGTHCPLCR